MQNRESPDFRSPEVGRYVYHSSAVLTSEIFFKTYEIPNHFTLIFFAL